MRLCLALATVLAAVILGACGEDREQGSSTGDSAGRSGLATEATGGEGGEQGAANPGSGMDGTSASGDEAADGARDRSAALVTDPSAVAGARVTSTGAVQTLPPREEARVKAMENSYASIRVFGEEATDEEATDITFALVQYLSARADGDWPTACARLYSVLRSGVEKGRSCVEAYARLMSRVPISARAAAAKIDVASVRREGDRAFVIYKTPATLSADMPMYVEDGVWKVGAIEAYALRPEQVE